MPKDGCLFAGFMEFLCRLCHILSAGSRGTTGRGFARAAEGTVFPIYPKERTAVSGKPAVGVFRTRRRTPDGSGLSVFRYFAKKIKKFGKRT